MTVSTGAELILNADATVDFAGHRLIVAGTVTAQEPRQQIRWTTTVLGLRIPTLYTPAPATLTNTAPVRGSAETTPSGTWATTPVVATGIDATSRGPRFDIGTGSRLTDVSLTTLQAGRLSITAAALDSVSATDADSGLKVIGSSWKNPTLSLGGDGTGAVIADNVFTGTGTLTGTGTVGLEGFGPNTFTTTNPAGRRLELSALSPEIPLRATMTSTTNLTGLAEVLVRGDQYGANKLRIQGTPQGLGGVLVAGTGRSYTQGSISTIELTDGAVLSGPRLRNLVVDLGAPNLVPTRAELRDVSGLDVTATTLSPHTLDIVDSELTESQVVLRRGAELFGDLTGLRVTGTRLTDTQVHIADSPIASQSAGAAVSPVWTGNTHIGQSSFTVEMGVDLGGFAGNDFTATGTRTIDVTYGYDHEPVHLSGSSDLSTVRTLRLPAPNSSHYSGLTLAGAPSLSGVQIVGETTPTGPRPVVSNRGSARLESVGLIDVEVHVVSPTNVAPDEVEARHRVVLRNINANRVDVHVPHSSTDFEMTQSILTDGWFNGHVHDWTGAPGTTASVITVTDNLFDDTRIDLIGDGSTYTAQATDNQLRPVFARNAVTGASPMRVGNRIRLDHFYGNDFTGSEDREIDMVAVGPYSTMRVWVEDTTDFATIDSLRLPGDIYGGHVLSVAGTPEGTDNLTIYGFASRYDRPGNAVHYATSNIENHADATLRGVELVDVNINVRPGTNTTPRTLRLEEVSTLRTLVSVGHADAHLELVDSHLESSYLDAWVGTWTTTDQAPTPVVTMTGNTLNQTHVALIGDGSTFTTQADRHFFAPVVVDNTITGESQFLVGNRIDLSAFGPNDFSGDTDATIELTTRGHYPRLEARISTSTDLSTVAVVKVPPVLYGTDTLSVAGTPQGTQGLSIVGDASGAAYGGGGMHAISRVSNRADAALVGVRLIDVHVSATPGSVEAPRRLELRDVQASRVLVSINDVTADLAVVGGTFTDSWIDGHVRSWGAVTEVDRPVVSVTGAQLERTTVVLGGGDLWGATATDRFLRPVFAGNTILGDAMLRAGARIDLGGWGPNDHTGASESGATLRLVEMGGSYEPAQVFVRASSDFSTLRTLEVTGAGQLHLADTDPVKLNRLHITGLLGHTHELMVEADVEFEDMSLTNVDVTHTQGHLLQIGDSTLVRSPVRVDDTSQVAAGEGARFYVAPRGTAISMRGPSHAQVGGSATNPAVFSSVCDPLVIDLYAYSGECAGGAGDMGASAITLTRGYLSAWGENPTASVSFAAFAMFDTALLAAGPNLSFPVLDIRGTQVGRAAIAVSDSDFIGNDTSASLDVPWMGNAPACTYRAYLRMHRTYAGPATFRYQVSATNLFASANGVAKTSQRLRSLPAEDAAKAAEKMAEYNRDVTSSSTVGRLADVSTGEELALYLASRSAEVTPVGDWVNALDAVLSLNRFDDNDLALNVQECNYPTPAGQVPVPVAAVGVTTPAFRVLPRPVPATSYGTELVAAITGESPVAQPVLERYLTAANPLFPFSIPVLSLHPDHVVPPQGVVPGMLTGLDVRVPAQGTAQVSWTDPAGASPVFYKVSYRAAGSSLPWIEVGAGGMLAARTVTLTGLDPGVTYEVRVRPVSVDGDGVPVVRHVRAAAPEAVSVRMDIDESTGAVSARWDYAPAAAVSPVDGWRWEIVDAVTGAVYSNGSLPVSATEYGLGTVPCGALWLMRVWGVNGAGAGGGEPVSVPSRSCG